MNKTKFSQGGRNLILLGTASFLIAFITTSISLYLYHDSGDIYLDRSRPGFLPDKAETNKKEEKKDDYSFDESGKINKKTLEEYLNNLKEETTKLDNFSDDPFSLDPLSDESLGVPNE